MKNRSSKLILIYTALAAIACAVLRYFQITGIIDTETGFFIEGSELGGLLIYAALAAAAVIFIVLAVLGSKKGDAAYSLSSDGMGRNATRWLGLSEFIGGMIIGAGVLDGKPIIEAAVIAAIAIMLIISGFILLGRIVPPAVTGHLKIACGFGYFLRAASHYNTDLTILQHSENLIVMIAYVCAAAFILASARFYARIESRGSRMREIITAGAAFILSATHTIANLLVQLTGSASASAFAAINKDIAAAALISGTFLAVLFCTEKKKDLILLADEEENSKKEKE